MRTVDVAPTRHSDAGRPFLSAHWRHLIMRNFRVPPDLVRPLVPRGTELDFYQGETYLSLVGFMFFHTRVLGVPIPFHRTFEELNLRFYVRRTVGNEVRRGVVFIKEIVPRWWVAKVARWLYNENYAVHPMSHEISMDDANSDGSGSIVYRWKVSGKPNQIGATVAGPPQSLSIGSHEEFIAEHYWGYCRQRNGGTIEYQVDHVPWRIWNVRESSLQCDSLELYGSELHRVLSQQPPCSTFVADGSPVVVYRPASIA